MKSKGNLICSIIELLIGLLAISSFIILLINEENMFKWLVALILAILLVINGIIGIIDYKNQK